MENYESPKENHVQKRLIDLQTLHYKRATLINKPYKDFMGITYNHTRLASLDKQILQALTDLNDAISLEQDQLATVDAFLATTGIDKE